MAKERVKSFSDLKGRFLPRTSSAQAPHSERQPQSRAKRDDQKVPSDTSFSEEMKRQGVQADPVVERTAAQSRPPESRHQDSNLKLPRDATAPTKSIHSGAAGSKRLSGAPRGRAGGYGQVIARMEGRAREQAAKSDVHTPESLRRAYHPGPGTEKKPVIDPERHRAAQADDRLKRITSGKAVIPGRRGPSFDLEGRGSEYLADGWRLSRDGAGGRTKTLRIGLDFGTAFTKVCVAEAKSILAVPWYPRRRSINRYLLPGTLWVTSKGACHLGELEGATERFEDLKLPLLVEKWGNEDEVKIIAFLALVMRFTRQWVLNSQDEIPVTNEIDWHVNVGLATPSWAETHRSVRFEALVRAAWKLSTSRESVTIDKASAIQRGASALRRDNSLDNACIAPEFVAQIASYVRSPHRRGDLHLMIDVGAGTVDVSTFNVHHDDKSGSDVFPVFASSVARLGTHYLMANRLADHDGHAMWSDIDRVPSISEMAEVCGVPVEELATRDEAITRATARVSRTVLALTKVYKYPKSPQWGAGVPAFLCGGGSGLDAYKGALGRIQFLIRPIALQKPSRLKAAITDGDFGRLAVAYGLSFGIDDLGELRPPSAVPDVPQRPFPPTLSSSFEDRYVSKDMV